MIGMPNADCGVRNALQVATETLLAEMNAAGHWEGELSSSALSTATAITALSLVDLGKHAAVIASGLRWLADHQNDDGGWGDTVCSKSNISTTALVWAAFAAAEADHEFPRVVKDAGRWLEKVSGGGEKLDVAALVSAIARRYGKDRTFSVPILMTLALSGRLGADGWKNVMPLPFELAALPHQFFGALRLPVVSYALPALIAIGQVIHHRRPTRNPITRAFRAATRARTLRKLEAIQPTSGGFLEATPLTSFVTMALAGCDLADHPVTRRGVSFLLKSARRDGSWPIDTNLATWVTTLSIKALGHQPMVLTPEQRMTLREWLRGQQYRTEHPYTHAAPGGWAWTDLPGGVPDADDTAGALLALLELGAIDDESTAAGEMGVAWLLDLQNGDGGIPTFCRGWGTLPFDRSAPDLTAHALRAWTVWLPHLSPKLKMRVSRSVARALSFLEHTQRDDGSWLPLWFGNEHALEDENPVYGTAQVLIALRELEDRDFALPPRMVERAASFLASMQVAEGGWSGSHDGPASVEETALAIEALAGTQHVAAVSSGVDWLVARVEDGSWCEPSPIGFYFAKLWYYERLYPLIFTIAALGKALRPVR